MHDNPPLPVVDPTTTNEKSINHDIDLLGESGWAPKYLLLLTRLCSAIACLAVAVLFTVRFDFSVVQATFYINALGFLLLAIVTCFQNGSRFTKIVSTATLYIYGFAVCFAVALPLDLIDRYANRRVAFDPLLALYCLPGLFYLADIFLMRARIRLRYRSAFLAALLYFGGMLTQTLMWVKIRGYAPFGAILFVFLYTMVLLSIGCIVIGITHVYGAPQSDDV